MLPAFALSSSSDLPINATQRFANSRGEYQRPPSRKITTPLTRTATLLTTGRDMRSPKGLSTSSSGAGPIVSCEPDCRFRSTVTHSLPLMSPVRYAGGILDRAAKLREDDDWISAALVSDAAMAVLIHNDQNLVTRADRREDTRAAILPLSAVREHVMAKGSSWVFLGLDGEVPLFGV